MGHQFRRAPLKFATLLHSSPTTAPQSPLHRCSSALPIQDLGGILGEISGEGGAAAAPAPPLYPSLFQRHKSSLVGTSGAKTCTKPFCEWLAGVIDGDGSIDVSKKGICSVEITLGLEDLRLLRYIQNMVSGGIKMRSGAKSYRYRLHHKPGMIKVMNCVNGHIRNSKRLVQMHRVCQVLDIPVIQPVAIDRQSNWFAGFFDADGFIDIVMKDRVPELSIGVTDRVLQDVESYKLVFGGNVYFDSGRNGYYRWSVESRKHIIAVLDYFKSSTFRSHKSQRFFLVEQYYRLYDLEAFKPDSIQHKAWLAFLDKWNKYMT